MLLFNLIIQFWIQHPALFYGTSFFIGTYAHFFGFKLIAFPLLLLWSPFLFRYSSNFCYFCVSLLVFLTGWFYSFSQYPAHPIPSKGVAGIALLHINEVRFHYSIFQNQWIYDCLIKEFHSADEHLPPLKNIPCLIILSSINERPLANQDYWLEGVLAVNKQGKYTLKKIIKNEWKPVPGSYSLAEDRLAWKNNVSDWITQKIKNSASSTFISGLVTGQFNDPLIREDFSRFGLMHLLAISGFHFAILAQLFTFLLALCFSFRRGSIILIFLLTAYSFFLGPQPSILRAWLMCTIALMGQLIQKQTIALNILGVALCICITYDPILSTMLGFQLSFITTIAILLFYDPFLKLLEHVFPKRRVTEMIEMNHLNQHGYCWSAFLRKGLALTFAVNLFAFPLTLFYFHQFPLMGLFYNLFFPLLASGSMFLFIVGSFTSLIPFLGEWIHSLNSSYTHFILRLTSNIPVEMDIALTNDAFSTLWITIYLSVGILGGIIWRDRIKKIINPLL